MQFKALCDVQVTCAFYWKSWQKGSKDSSPNGQVFPYFQLQLGHYKCVLHAFFNNTSMSKHHLKDFIYFYRYFFILLKVFYGISKYLMLRVPYTCELWAWDSLGSAGCPRLPTALAPARIAIPCDALVASCVKPAAQDRLIHHGNCDCIHNIHMKIEINRLYIQLNTLHLHKFE